MSEDSARNRMDSGPQNLAVLRHMALNVMRKEETKMSLRGKLKKPLGTIATSSNSSPFFEMQLPCSNSINRSHLQKCSSAMNFPPG
jgi:hypothetical protein